MKWVTREHPRTDRIACPWLIRKFIDPDAEILYVPPADVLAVAKREDAISFDAPDARYTHRDRLCSFEVLIADFKIDDPAATTRLLSTSRRTGRPILAGLRTSTLSRTTPSWTSWPGPRFPFARSSWRSGKTSAPRR